MKVRIICICMLAALAAGTVSAAEPPLVLDIDTAVETALENNFSLERERKALEMKERVAKTSWNGFLPQMNASVSLSRLNQEPPDPFGTGDVSRWILAARFQAQLTVAAALFQSIKQTRLQFEAGRITLAKARATLERDVKKQFYQVLLLQRQRDLTAAGIENARERYEQARVNYENGLIPRYQVLAAQVAYENAKPSLEQLENGIQSALAGLKMSLGLDFSRDITLEGAITVTQSPVEGDSVMRQVLGGSLDLQEMQGRIYTLEQSVKLARSGMYPALNISWSFDPAFQGNPFTKPIFADVAADWRQQSGALTISVLQSLDPLLPASSTRIEIEKVKNQLEQLALSKAEARMGIEMQVKNTVRELEQAVSSIRAKELNVEVAEEAYALAEEAFAAGTMELLEVKNTEQELDQARYDLLNAHYTYMSGMLDLEYLAGGEIEPDARTGN